MPTNDPPHSLLSTPVVQTVLMLDVAEYVRIMEEDQHDMEQRWRHLVGEVRNKVLPVHGGHIVETRGDSLVLTFPQVQPAAQAAFAINRICGDINEGVKPHRHILLRMGIHVGEVYTHENEVSGHAVNLAARLMASVAGPGEVVISADAYDQLTPMLDADVEDLGDCYLKHVSEPLRSYRIGPPGPRPVIEAGTATMPSLRPTIAVIPFVHRGNDSAHEILGEVLADEIISALSRTVLLSVISRLSTTAFRGRQAALAEIGAHLKADYVLTGKYQVLRNDFSLLLELADVRTEHIQWSDSIRGKISEFANSSDNMIARVVSAIGDCILAHELQRGQTMALPTLESYSLLINAIVRMHRGSAHELDRAHHMLQALIERVPRLAIPRAWLARLHVLRVGQGWATDVSRDTSEANRYVDSALERDSSDSWVLAVSGLVEAYLNKNLDTAINRLEMALAINPNSASAWVWSTSAYAWHGHGEEAVNRANRALELSPFDPHMYSFTSNAGLAYAVAGHYDKAIELSQRSLRENRMYTATQRLLIISLALSGRTEEAHTLVAGLLTLEPELTVGGWRRRYPGNSSAHADLFCDALRKAGIPR